MAKNIASFVTTETPFSWEGKEHLRKKLVSVAKEVVESDAACTEAEVGSCISGQICVAMKNPSTSGLHPKIVRAGKAQEKLAKLHASLVQEHKLNFDFVRREWVTILNPSQEEKDLCDKLVAQARRAKRA
jgi:hypothetical protein